nr:RNA-directed DNA polymerase, eukaryota [Tanacetum cinerariifolium]
MAALRREAWPPRYEIDQGVASRLSSAKRFIDDGICVLDGSPTKWLNQIPIKINNLALRVALNKLPTRFNMSLRGMEVSTMKCPVCRVGNETSDNLFFSYLLASAMISRFCKWWELLDMVFQSYHGWENWLDGLRYGLCLNVQKSPRNRTITAQELKPQEKQKQEASF